MNILIRKAKIEDAQGCLDCVRDSQLWDAYFEVEKSLELIESEIEKGQVYVAINGDGSCVGFMSVNEEGCFRKFPYLAILSVHATYRSKGVGKMLLDEYEAMSFQKENRAFVLCSDFNTRGQAFYMQNGYRECGVIIDLFKVGIAEHLFIKYKEDKSVADN